SQVFAAGELQNFPLQLRRLVDQDPGPIDVSAMARSALQPLAGLGQHYLDSTRPRTGHTPRFIDKLPLNFLYLGLIRKALPNAKLVCLRRDPMDVCLSNYRQLFASNFSYYRYNLDLLDCGRYYIEFDRLMRHWHDVMPGEVLDVHYEAVVTDTEPQVRALLQFCGLPFEKACLDFHEKSASVATPSAVQVRQKIYTSSMARWRRYGDAMQPLYDLLSAAGYY
ncbi:MAG: sulfotransferase, partial [Halioglobus sp.]|nr:sulfotransferase [Halioglobus sp.]